MKRLLSWTLMERRMRPKPRDSRLSCPSARPARPPLFVVDPPDFDDDEPLLKESERRLLLLLLLPPVVS